jgi:hypothetical protein
MAAKNVHDERAKATANNKMAAIQLIVELQVLGVSPGRLLKMIAWVMEGDWPDRHDTQSVKVFLAAIKVVGL